MGISREMTPVCHGDVVHLEGRSDAGSWVVDREQGFLVLLPDSLISGTSISSSIRCMRRAVLGDMFKVKGFSNTIHCSVQFFMLIDYCVCFLNFLVYLEVDSTLTYTITQCYTLNNFLFFLCVVMQSFDGGSKQMLNGTMVHEVFQRAATAKDFSLETLSKLANQALCSPQYLGDM